MDVDQPLTLLGGLSPAAFMRRHWQKKPLLVRQALPGATAPLTRAALFDLAGREDVESRLVVRDGAHWRLRHGPLPRRALPPLARREWTLLVQGVDLHDEGARALLERFRFVPDARLDDLMISYASDGGGVGPHLDSYDVFLVQLHGRRRWRIGPVRDDTLVEDVPLRILARFEPQQEWCLEPGDMLYLPPRWGHDGVAEGECMTASVGFRAPAQDALARELLQACADAIEDDGPLYRDPAQPATATPALVPSALQQFAQRTLERLWADPKRLHAALGEVLTEPKPQVWFEPGEPLAEGCGVSLDRRTRMMYDAAHVFINGEAFRAGGRDATLMRRLADARALDARDVARLGREARALLDDWACAGWVRAR